MLCYTDPEHFDLLFKCFGLLFCADMLNSVFVLEGDDGNWSIGIVNLPWIEYSTAVLCNEKSHHYLFNNADAVRGEHISC